MRKLLIATSTAAMALILSGMAFAENDQFQPDQTTITPQAADSGSNSATVAPPEASANEELVSPKQIEQAKPIQPAEDIAVSEQLRDLIENKLQQYVPRRQDRAGVEAFYRKRDFAPLWVSAGKPLPRVQQAADFLHDLAADGLDPEDYPTPRFSDASPARLAADELALTNSVLTFVRHASTGRVAFTRVSGSIYFDLKAPDPEQVLEKIVASRDLRATLDSFNPQQPQYKALKAELALARHSQSAAVPKGAAASGKDRGEPKSEAARIDIIVANMERWRWLPRQLGAAYVMVNVPDFTLKVVNLGKTMWSTRIVAGKPGTYATPLLTETMKFITVNPTWNVPPSIIRNEYLPALERDPNALARVGLQIGRNSDGSIRVYQPPGERNALGRIRFNFPNRFLVYQHDTPDKNLFEKTTRAYSHGCMRVQNPDRYAEVLLSLSQPEDGYSIQRIRSLYGTGERTINFKNPIPVYITYQTAFVDDAGKLQARPDIYGLDKAITNLLKGDSQVADIPISRNYSSGSKPVMAQISRGRRNQVADESVGWEREQGWDRGWNGWGRDRQPNFFNGGGRSGYGPFDLFRSW
jgi:murein L,D-transpeptidase YcbB/YkuD